MYLFLIISSIWWGDWTNSGIDELLIRRGTACRAPTLFLGSKPIEKEELRCFLDSLTSGDSLQGKGTVHRAPTMWLKERLSVALQDFERFEWDAGAIKDSLNHGFLLVGKGVDKGFIKLFIEPIARFGDSTGEYPSRKWQELVACDYLKGYIKVGATRRVAPTLVCGREPIKWGPSPRATLVLSGTAPPFDLVRGGYQTQKFKVSFFATQLDPFGKINRYLSGHRIEYKVGTRHGVSLHLGFSEVALFGGEGRFPELYYLNPIFIYYPYQWNRKSKVNILWGLDLNLFLKGFGFYTEVMVDDTPYQPTEKGDRPKIGANLGIRGTFLNNYWFLEYSGVTRWTYDHKIPWQQGTYLGYPIGHPKGPDFDEFFLGIVHHLSRNIDIISNISFLRKGEGTIDEPYPSHFPRDYWLTGELKTTLQFEIGTKWYKLPGFVITCKGGCIITDSGTFPVVSFFIGSI